MVWSLVFLFRCTIGQLASPALPGDLSYLWVILANSLCLPNSLGGCSHYFSLLATSPRYLLTGGWGFLVISSREIWSGFSLWMPTVSNSYFALILQQASWQGLPVCLAGGFVVLCLSLLGPPQPSSMPLVGVYLLVISFALSMVMDSPAPP